MVFARSLQLRNTRLEWVARRLALSGCLSRREAVAAIEQGAVQVDGRTLTRDVQVCDEALISYRGRPIPPAAAWPALFGVIKPPRVACKYTADNAGPTLKTLVAPSAPQSDQRQAEAQDRRNGRSSGISRRRDHAGGPPHEHDEAEEIESYETHETAGHGNAASDHDRGFDAEGLCGSGTFLSNSLPDLGAPSHLIPVNFLPLHAEGLVLLTNNGEFAHALRDPANKIITAYDFRVTGTLPPMDLWRQWALGVRVGCVNYGRVWGQLLRPCPSGAWIRLKLVEPPAPDFRSLLGSCGLKIRRMRLHAFGPYLSSSVPAGCLLPLQIHQSLQSLAPRQRRRLLLVPAEGEIQQTVAAAEHLSKLKGGGFPAARLLKETSVLVKGGLQTDNDS
ncbi:hypothetical protein Efla_000592 [Eimeria flavescens]